MSERDINWKNLDDRFPSYRNLLESNRNMNQKLADSNQDIKKTIQLSQHHTDSKIDSINKNVDNRLTHIELRLVLWIVATGLVVIGLLFTALK